MHELITLALMAGTITIGENGFPLGEPLCGG